MAVDKAERCPPQFVRLNDGLASNTGGSNCNPLQKELLNAELCRGSAGVEFTIGALCFVNKRPIKLPCHKDKLLPLKATNVPPILLSISENN
jgi:hypothetical protein